MWISCGSRSLIDFRRNLASLVGSPNTPLLFIPPSQKGEHKFWKEGLADAAMNVKDAEDDDAMVADAAMQSDLSFDNLVQRKVDEVGGITPVQDFDTLLARRDGDQFVLIAIRGMKKVINELLETAYKGNTYGKALSCIAALRSGCVTEEVRFVI